MSCVDDALAVLSLSALDLHPSVHCMCCSKLDNVLITRDHNGLEVAKLADFGLFKVSAL